MSERCRNASDRERDRSHDRSFSFGGRDHRDIRPADGQDGSARRALGYLRTTGRRMGLSMRNWAGNQAFHSRRFFEPESVEELAEIVRGSASIRALGTRHSFNQLADTTGDHVSLARLDVPIRLEPDSRDGHGRWRTALRRAVHVPRIGRLCAGQPRLAAAYLDRGFVRDRQPRIGCSERQPRGRGRGARDRPGRWRDRADRPRHIRRRAAWSGRLARRARRRHAA